MNIAEIDKNFKLDAVKEQDVEWHSVLDTPFSTHGVSYDAARGLFRRMPTEAATAVSDLVDMLSSSCAGGRVRFVTDSPYVALRCVGPRRGIMSHMTLVGTYGFSLLDGKEFVGMYTPSEQNLRDAVDGKFAFEGIRYFAKKEGLHRATLFMPLYNGVNHLRIGIKKGSKLLAPKPYRYEKPIVFYGSSITQGGCASRPGNDYIGLLSQWLDSDILNLGFSGNAKGEQTMADYLAAQKNASVMVLDYDHNAPTVAHLQSTHYNLYKTVRKANPTLPIVLVSKPDFSKMDGAGRRKVIYDTYRRATEAGDGNIYFIDGETLFGKNGERCCTVDGTHPNDLGFYRMAKTMLPVLQGILKSK